MRTSLLGLPLCCLLLASGCAGFAFSSHRVNMASVYASTKANERVTDNTLGTKTGEACSTSILGIYTAGDSSVTTAAQSGGIKKIASVDNRFTNVLGIWAEYCVVVTGD
jgi:hypothetical protein